jgi:hypothetical protein
MLISCSESKRGLKENDGGGWSSDGMVSWLGRRQNADAVEWWRE